MKRVAAATGVVAFIAVGCSGGGSGPPAAGPSSPQATSSTTTSSAPAAPTTARAIIQALKAAGAPMDGIVVFTAATDSNHLLGRPKGYLSKGAWRDRRVRPSDTPGLSLGDIDVGGGVEVFATSEMAITRGGYIQSLGSTIANEYDYACGRALLRISGYLVPSAAKAYERQAGQILHVACSPVT